MREIGKVLGISDTSLKKKDLLAQIAQVAQASAEEESAQPVEAKNDTEVTEEAPRKRGRRPRMNSLRIEENKPDG